MLNDLSCFSSAGYVEDVEREGILRSVIEHYLRFKEYPRALCIAMELNDTEAMQRIFKECADP